MSDKLIGVKGVVLQDGRVLLLQRVRKGGFQHWDLPGGYIEGDEDPKAALLREVAEELPTAEDVRIGKYLSQYVLKPPAPPGVVEVYQIKAKLDRTEVSTEHVGHLWVSAANFERLTQSHPEWHLPDSFAHAIGVALKKVTG